MIASIPTPALKANLFESGTMKDGTPAGLSRE
jgi:hypothetical protein